MTWPTWGPIHLTLVCVDGKPNNLAESKLDAGQLDHVYEPLPPARDDHPYRLQTTNLFAKCDPFSDTDGDDFQFSLDSFKPFPPHS